MEYNVPQFVEEEAKILGPFNIRDFFILFGAGLMSAMFFFLFRQWLAIILASIVFGGAVALLLVRVNSRPLYTIVIAAIQFFWSPRLYIWKKEGVKQEDLLREKIIAETEPVTKMQTKTAIPQALSLKKIKELAGQLDVKNQGASSEREESQQSAESSLNTAKGIFPTSARRQLSAKEKIRALVKQLDMPKASGLETANIQQIQSPGEQKRAEQMPRYSPKENSAIAISPSFRKSERKILTPETIRELAQQLDIRSN
jgi:hypothetical protein